MCIHLAPMQYCMYVKALIMLHILFSPFITIIPLSPSFPPSFPLSFPPPSLPASSGAAQVLRGSYFGTGDVAMTVGDIQCYGYYPYYYPYYYASETDIADCYGFRYGYYRNIPSYACTPYSQHVAGVRCIGEYARVCKSVQEYARVCKSVQEYARVCKSMQEYALYTF